MSDDGKRECPDCHGSTRTQRIGPKHEWVLGPCANCGATGYLYTQAALDAAIKAERERMIDLVHEGDCPPGPPCPVAGTADPCTGAKVCWRKFFEEAPDAPHAD